MKRIVFLISLLAFLFVGTHNISSQVISCGPNVPSPKAGYVILAIYGYTGHEGGFTRMSNGSGTYDLNFYSGYTGATTYYYVKPGVYTIVLLSCPDYATFNNHKITVGEQIVFKEGQNLAEIIYH